MTKNKVLAFITIISLVLVAVIGFNFAPDNVYALVSIDINPSINLIVNEDQVVVEIIPRNAEAEEVIDEDMVGKNVIDVIDKIIKISEKKNYLHDDNNNILISSASLDQTSNATLNELINEYIEKAIELETEVHMVYVESDQETAEQSFEEGVSLGKLEMSKLTAEEDIVVETSDEKDEDDLEELVEFVEKLRFVDDNDNTVLTELLAEFNDDNTLINDDADIKQLKETAKSLFFNYKDEYKHLWDDDDNDDDLEELIEFIEKLRFVDDTDNEVLTELLAEFNDDNTLTNEDVNIKQLKDTAKSLFFKYKDEYKHLWDEDDEDEDKDEEDLEDLVEFVVKLRFVDDTDNEVLTELLAEFNADNTLINESVNIKQLKETAKSLFFEYKDEYKHLWDDNDSDEDNDDKDFDSKDDDDDNDSKDDNDDDDSKGKAKGKNK